MSGYHTDNNKLITNQIMHLDAWSASFEHLTLEEIQYRTVLQFHMKELLSNILSGTYSFVIVCP